MGVPVRRQNRHHAAMPTGNPNPFRSPNLRLPPAAKSQIVYSEPHLVHVQLKSPARAAWGHVGLLWLERSLISRARRKSRKVASLRAWLMQKQPSRLTRPSCSAGRHSGFVRNMFTFYRLLVPVNVIGRGWVNLHKKLREVSCGYFCGVYRYTMRFEGRLRKFRWISAWSQVFDSSHCLKWIDLVDWRCIVMDWCQQHIWWVILWSIVWYLRIYGRATL